MNTTKTKCKFCYDKGYFTELIGGERVTSDFGRLVRYNSGYREVKNYCTKCAKGKRMKLKAGKK